MSSLEGEERASRAAVPAQLTPRHSADAAPLTFVQQSHWNSYIARERRSMREVAGVTGLSGRLDISAFRHAFSAVVQRHESLRTRVRIEDGAPVQTWVSAIDAQFELDDVSCASEDARGAVLSEQIDSLITTPIDLDRDPPFAARLVKTCPDEHRFIVGMNHLICDARSLGIFIAETLQAYEQAVRGTCISLPQIPIQYADYAVWQRRAHQSWLERHGAYWTQRLSGCRRLSFPGARPAPETGGWAVIAFKIDRDLKTALRAWCRSRRTTLALGVFTVYAALVLRWCDAAEGVIRFQTDGRTSLKLHNTIGFFATPLSLRIELREDDGFEELLQRVAKEYGNASAHADSGYLEAQAPKPDFARNTLFNWIPAVANRPGASLPTAESAGVVAAPMRFNNPALRELALDGEPIMTLYDTAEEIEGEMAFPQSRFDGAAIEGLVSSFLKLLRLASHERIARATSVPL